MLPSAVFTHLNAGVRAAAGPDPVLMAWWVHPASVTLAKHCGDRALEAEQKPPVGQARVVDRVAVSDQAATVAADVEQGTPVRAVAREAGDLDRDDQADLAERDACDQVLEALAVRRRRGAQAKVGVDDLDVRLTPAQVAGALPQGVLQPQAFLVAQHLLRGGLAHVDHGAAVQAGLSHLGFAELGEKACQEGVA